MCFEVVLVAIAHDHAYSEKEFVTSTAPKKVNKAHAMSLSTPRAQKILLHHTIGELAVLFPLSSTLRHQTQICLCC